MFVEKITWTVPPGSATNSKGLFNNISSYMQSSGGLLKALVGNIVGSENEIVSVSFWNSWEDLTRFLRNSQTPLIGRSSGIHSAELQRHHFEVIWDWPDNEIKAMSDTAFWVLYDYIVDEAKVESLLDELRHYATELAQRDGFGEAALWMDKNCTNHAMLATQWKKSLNQAEIDNPEKIKRDLHIDQGQVKIRVLKLQAARLAFAN